MTNAISNKGDGWGSYPEVSVHQSWVPLSISKDFAETCGCGVHMFLHCLKTDFDLAELAQLDGKLCDLVKILFESLLRPCGLTRLQLRKNVLECIYLSPLSVHPSIHRYSYANYLSTKNFSCLVRSFARFAPLLVYSCIFS